MRNARYELHTHTDPNFPILFHFDTLLSEHDFCDTHWHDALEILYFREGRANVTVNAETFSAECDDIIIINPNCVHHVDPIGGTVKYYCLIISTEYCEKLGFSVTSKNICPVIKDARVSGLYEGICSELQLHDKYSKEGAKGYISVMLSYIFRKYVSEASPELAHNDVKAEAVKTAIRYIRKNYTEPVKVEDIAEECMLSKYYFCRIFKNITGSTVIKYLNMYRCMKARELLSSGKYTVSEAALECGFENMSYFSKTYKAYSGSVPSMAKKIPENG